MNLLRILATASLTVLGLLGVAVSAQSTYPERQIRMVVPFPPGAFSDTAARILAKEMSTDLGVPIFVENRPGASGLLGLAAVSEWSGRWLHHRILANTSLMALRTQQKPLDLEERLNLVGGALILQPVVAVNPKMLDIQNMRELEAHMKANPGTLYTTVGQGTTSQAVVEVMAKRRGLKVSHVPHKGLQPATMDVLAGRPADPG